MRRRTEGTFMLTSRVFTDIPDSDSRWHIVNQGDLDCPEFTKDIGIA
jgi:hypothetical protein